ncbi:hypothetical protein DQ237_01610 [Blastococcus sp. TF02-8]|uniref:hypothetical protein n=1 Tax=Blastococcus sp. TF02-8 TaxID=2250574 RepID=UPI000DEA0946|nr:hypothetical protein [Blastococcus sp. TF02-8]RBY97652.1 hypothetical protein DQ237_01610 [Blastococcus sp. TF02-8]
MNPRTTTSGRAARARTTPPTAVRRPGLYLGVAAAGAVLVNVLIGVEPAAQAEAGSSPSLSVAQELGLTADAAPVDVTDDLAPLEQLAASRSTRQAAETQAQQAQAAADQAELDRRKAEEEARIRAEEEAKAAAAAQATARGAAVAAASTAVDVIAKISNSAGPVSSRVQAAANAVVSNVPGADDITLGGTRASATDPHGHPSGNALDYMVLTDEALGDAIVEYHRAHWSELGVEYLIWQQRMLSSPNGSWTRMEDRGDATANHYDHVHVNYR